MGRYLFLAAVAVVIFGGIASSIASNREKAESVKQTAAVLQRLHGGDVGNPITFSKYCGNPDHVRKTVAALTWIYESKGVLLTFVRLKKSDAYELAFSEYDPVRWANWGEYQHLKPEAAVSRLGCAVPPDIDQLERGLHEDFVYQSAFDGVRELRALSARHSGFVLSSARLMQDGSACYLYSTSGGRSLPQKALLRDGELLTVSRPKFMEAWHAACERAGGNEKASELSALLNTWDHAS